jgi:hypothetical protein
MSLKLALTKLICIIRYEKWYYTNLFKIFFIASADVFSPAKSMKANQAIHSEKNTMNLKNTKDAQMLPL